MKTTITLLTITFFCSLQLAAQETKDVCDCPPPTLGDIGQLCKDIYLKEVSSDSSDLSFRYQETLWRISCAKDGEESLEQARIKIQKMWLKYRSLFSCNIPGVTIPGGNVSKLSMETGFSPFMQDAILDYKLDMNFKDPADNRTILDFVSDQIVLLKKSSVNVKTKIIEYEELYVLLKKNGAKHANEL